MSSPTEFVEEFTTLLNKHKSSIACSNNDINSIIGAILQGSYLNVMRHMVICEVLKMGDIQLSGPNMLILKVEHVKLSMDANDLSVNIDSVGTASFNVRLINNELAAASPIEHAVATLTALHNESDITDLLDLVNARIAYFLAVITSALPIMGVINADITTALEAAQNDS